MSFIKIFVYGTLKPGEANYQQYCGEHVVESYPAITYGQLFNLSVGYPAMTVGHRIIHGFILSFLEPKIFLELDRLEDYHPERHSDHNEYQRRKIKTFRPDGEYLGMAWSYLMLPEKVNLLGGVFLASGCWIGRD